MGIWQRVSSHIQSVFKASSTFRGPLFLSRALFDSGTEDTVFALSSGQGKAGLAVVRVSGPQSSEAVRKLGGFRVLPTPRTAKLKKLIDPTSGDTIDHGLVLWFPGPNSFTGEDSAEFHVHGGTAVVLALLNSLSRLTGFRHAEPGDFTKRAFFNGKLDLTEVEGLADLIHAETEAQRKQALRQMEGDLSKVYTSWSERLLQCVAHVEATIDFGEEENIEDDVIPQVYSKVEQLLKEINDHLSDGRKGERLRSGIHVAIIGAPNVGKSSLLNILCQRPAAIVSEYAGTTRDVVESSLDIFGYPVVLSDTAGLRKVNDPIEEEGIRRAIQKGRHADLKILMADCSSLQPYLNSSHTTLQNKSLKEFARIVLNNSLSNEWVDQTVAQKDTVVIINKTDLIKDSVKKFTSIEDAPVSWISCKTHDGMESFLSILREKLCKLGGNPLSGSPHLTQARHRHHLQQCSESLKTFLNTTPDEANLVGAAEELRMGLRQLGRITGKVGVEEILDVVFSEFCIGK